MGHGRVGYFVVPLSSKEAFVGLFARKVPLCCQKCLSESRVTGQLVSWSTGLQSL